MSRVQIEEEEEERKDGNFFLRRTEFSGVMRIGFGLGLKLEMNREMLLQMMMMVLFKEISLATISDIWKRS